MKIVVRYKPFGKYEVVKARALKHEKTYATEGEAQKRADELNKRKY